MNQKKAKGLRKFARKFVEVAKRPQYETDAWYKKMKESYKRKKGQL